MSLLNKASIVTTPTAYENGKILSVKPSIVLGEELVVNGTFQTDSDWTKGSNWTINNGVAIYTSSGFSNLSQTNLGLDVGKTYKLTINLIGGSGSVCRFYFGGSSSTAYTLVNGLNVITGVAVSDKITFRNLQQSDFTIDNVSVKEVLDADFDFTRNSSATRVNSQGLIEDMQILSGDLVSNGDFSQEGSELVTNGDFETDSNWVKQAGWSIGGGTANCDGSQNLPESVYQGGVTIVGKTYKITYTLVSITSGTVRAVAGTLGGAFQSTIGTHTEYLTATSNTVIQIQANASFIGSIDNVSVKEVGQDWTLGTGTTIGDGIANITQSGGVLAQSGGIMVSGKSFKVTFTISNYVSGSIAVSNLTPTMYRSGNGTYTLNAVGAGGDFRFFSSSFIGSVSNISVIEITSDTNLPRIDYTGGEGHWLFEPQSTNLFTESENFSNGDWTVYGGDSITPNNAVSPQGTQNASKLNDVGGIYEQRPYNPNTNYIFSVFAKTDTSTSITINFVDQAAGYLGGAIKYTFATNVASVILQSANGSVVAEKEDYGNGWIRVILKFTTNSAQNFNYQSIEFQGGDGWIWGAQLEQLSYATSYIPTEGSIKTRLQDAAFGAGSSDLINSTEGTLYFEGSGLSSSVGNKVISLNDGTNINSFWLYIISSSNGIRIFDGVTIGSFYTINAYENNKFALVYNSTNTRLFINGSLAITIPFKSMSNLNKLSFSDGNEGQKFEGNVKCVAVFKEALNNDELECLTGEGYESFNALALANNYTII